MVSNPNPHQIEQLQQENVRLRKAVEELSVLNDIAVAISSTLSLDKIVELIVQKCVKHFRAEQGAVMLLEHGDQGNAFHTMVRKMDSSVSFLPYRLDTQITGWMLKHQKPLLVNDFDKDERFQKIGESDWPVLAMLCVPLLLKGKMIGVLSVFNKRSREEFTLEDQRLLSIIAAQSAQVIENARLYKEEQAYLRMQEEMRLARDIQQNLLPKAPPEIPGYQIAGKSVPAKDVGGDFFDYIFMDENRIALCLGDVSGKGMPAAMLMANIQATLRAQTLPGLSCKKCIERSNQLLFQSTDPQKFATLFYGFLDKTNHRFQYCNAGHDNPLLFSGDKEPTRLGTGGIVLGFVPYFPFEEAKISLQPDDVLLLYSDGITEAMNAKGEEFGEDRLATVVKNHRNQAPEKIIEEILQNVKAHIGNEPQMDDMTLMVIKRVKE
ncbi:MAG: hypothetical protein Kow0042_11220 [Calditrichia bacterium]